jgi:hypothetical protein
MPDLELTQCFQQWGSRIAHTKIRADQIGVVVAQMCMGGVELSARAQVEEDGATAEKRLVVAVDCRRKELS